MAKEVKRSPQVEAEFLFKAGDSQTLKDLANSLDQDFKQSAKIIRKDLDRLVTHFIQVESLVDEGAKVASGIEQILTIIPEYMLYIGEASVEGSGGTRRAQFGSGLETAFEEVKRSAKELFDGRFFNGKDFGHQDITPSGLRLTGLAVALQKLEERILKIKTPKTEGGKARRKVTTKAITLQDQTIRGLRSVKKSIQTMIIASRLVENMAHDISLKNSTEKYDALTKEFNKLSNLQDTLTIEKNKFFDILQGKSKIELKVESKAYNQYKNFYQKAFGRNASSILDKQYPEKLFKQKFLDKVDIGDLVGSPSIEDKIVRDISKLAIGKKTKASRHKATAKKKIPSPVKKVKSIKRSKMISAAVKAKTAAKRKTAERKRNTEVTGQEELFKLEKLINKRLPAEIRRNMGRPALRNQTGRFSNSAELESLRPTAKGLSGEFTYQLSPYETFENTGSRRWPTGYNPKPLIAKSIRNLAMQYTEQKLVSLRRT